MMKDVGKALFRRFFLLLYTQLCTRRREPESRLLALRRVQATFCADVPDLAVAGFCGGGGVSRWCGS